MKIKGIAARFLSGAWLGKQSQRTNRQAVLAPELDTGQEDITAVVIHCGESTLDACLAALSAQTRPIPIRIVADVHPLPASLDAALDVCETKWLLVVDADTIVAPDCVAVLGSHLVGDVGVIIGMLEDKVYGVIGGLRLMDAQTLNEAHFRHPVDDRYPDRKAINFLEARGLKRIVLGDVVGRHDPYQTDFETFRRFYGTYQKRSRQEHNAMPHAQAILEYFSRTGDVRGSYFMFAGLVCGTFQEAQPVRDYILDEEQRSRYLSVAEKYK